MQNCGLYLRLSKEDEKRGESTSIETQRRILQEYARQKGFTVFDEYVDVGYTGTNLNRPAFQRMLGDVEKGKLQIILVKDLSRLGRNSGRVNLLLDEYFPEHRVRFISVGEGIDTAERSVTNSIVAPVQNLVNELYAGDISRKIHAALDIKMRQGQFIGAFAPYGYQKDPEDKNHLLIDEEAAQVVRRMFQMAAAGESPREIAEIFQREGILTPSQYRYERNPHLDKSREAAEWKKGTVGKILRNEVYLGHTLQGKTMKPSFKSRVSYEKPREEWVVVEHTHKPLVDAETWQRVREQMEKRNKKGK